jgi:hypothetical protein
MFCHGVTKMKKKHLEQRYAIQFWVKLGEASTDTYLKIQKAFGNDLLRAQVHVFRWHRDFVSGRETVEDEP